MTFRLLLAAIALIASFSNPVNADIIQPDNWRLIYMNGHYSSGGASDSAYFYSVHTTRQENLLVSFDLSSYSGQTITEDATLSMFVDSGWVHGPNYTVELHQLSQNNSNVNLDTAGSYTTGTSNWIHNNGSSLPHLNYNNSVLDITSGLIGTYSSSTAPANGSIFDFTIAKDVVQSWIDDLAPSIVVFTADNSPWVGANFDMARSGLDISANADSAAPTTNVSEPSSLAVLALALLGFTSRRLKKQ